MATSILCCAGLLSSVALGANAGHEPETFAIQNDLELLDALYGVDACGDQHGWSNGNHGGFRYSPQVSSSNLSLPEYQEARKVTLLCTRHDPTQTNWMETPGVVDMLRVRTFLHSNSLIQTPGSDSQLSRSGLF